MADNRWPALRVDDWAETRDTLHMWAQIVGKVRLVHSPLINHWWQVTLYVSPRGLTTSAIPYQGDSFDIEFDFIDHRLLIRGSEGGTRTVALEPKPVAEFYAQCMNALSQLGIEAKIQSRPNEVDPAIPFADDYEHASYDPAAAHLFWRQLLSANRVINEFRAHFIGKVSPVHFFWGAFDMAVTRFSGRRAPEHPGAPNVGNWVMVEAYSHEVSSAGFWPGGGMIQEPAFYAYAYPAPEGFGAYPVQPAKAWYSSELGEFLLTYEAVRTSPQPDETLLAFLQSTYEAAADLAGWDRAALERGDRRA